MSDDAKVPLPVAFTCGLCGIGDYYIAEHLRLYGDARERAARAAAFREAADYCDSLVADEIATGKVDHNEIAWTQHCAIALRARAEGDGEGGR